MSAIFGSSNPAGRLFQETRLWNQAKATRLHALQGKAPIPLFPEPTSPVHIIGLRKKSAAPPELPEAKRPVRHSYGITLTTPRS